MNSQFFLIILVIGVFAFATTIVIYQYSRNKELLTIQAEKLGGKVLPGDLFNYLRLVFEYRNIEVELYSVPGGKNSPPHTYLKANLSGLSIPYEIKLSKNGFLQKIAKSFGQETLEIGNDEFSRTFVLRASDEYYVHRIFDLDVQNCLLALNKYSSPNVAINPQQLKLSINEIPKKTDQYDLFIGTALLIIGKLT